jgi:hypothetical protein
MDVRVIYRTCPTCGHCFGQPDDPGRKRRFCSDACNQRLVDACYLWAFAALTASPGARRCYDGHRARGASHHQALRALGNRLVGILHGCLTHRVAYQEQVAWPTAKAAA